MAHAGLEVAEAGAGATSHDGLRREIREETGLEVEPVALTGIYKNMNRAIIPWSSGQLATTSEAYAIRILNALHEHAPAAIRQHDGTQLL